MTDISPGTLVRAVRRTFMFRHPAGPEVGRTAPGDVALVLGVRREGTCPGTSWGAAWGLSVKVLWRGQVAYTWFGRDEEDRRYFEPVV